MERGGGAVNTATAMGLPLITSPAALSWGNVLINDAAELDKTVQLRNVSQQNQSVTLSPELSSNEGIESVEILPTQADLAPFDSIDVVMKIKFSPPEQPGEVRDTNGAKSVSRSRFAFPYGRVLQRSLRRRQVYC